MNAQKLTGAVAGPVVREQYDKNKFVYERDTLLNMTTLTPVDSAKSRLNKSLNLVPDENSGKQKSKPKETSLEKSLKSAKRGRPKMSLSGSPMRRVAISTEPKNNPFIKGPPILNKKLIQKMFLNFLNRSYYWRDMQFNQSGQNRNVQNSQNMPFLTILSNIMVTFLQHNS